MTYKINGDCLFCMACILKCPVKAIKDDGGIMTISEKLCLDCGLCAKECPHIFITPDETKESKKIIINDDQYLEIMPELCNGCSICQRFCPESAIEGVVKEPFVLDRSKCIKCGICLHKCKREAIKIC